jgi:hypothetical protein
MRFVSALTKGWAFPFGSPDERAGHNVQLTGRPVRLKHMFIRIAGLLQR